MERPTRRSDPVHSAETLGDEVARLRKARGLSQTDLAEAIGLDRRYVYSLESAKPTLYGSRLFAALRELGAHIEIVFEDDPPVSDAATPAPDSHTGQVTTGQTSTGQTDPDG